MNFGKAGFNLEFITRCLLQQSPASHFLMARGVVRVCSGQPAGMVTARGVARVVE